MDKRINIEITTKSIFTLVLILAAGWIIYLLQSVLILFFIGLILALALEPLVDKLVKKNIPHSLSVAIVIFIAFAVIISLVSIAFRPLIEQISSLINTLPAYIDSLVSIRGLDIYSDAIFSQISQGASNVLSVTLGAFSGALSTMIAFVFMVYILLDFENLRNLFTNVFPVGKRVGVSDMVLKIEIKLRDWLRGQVILMLIIGASTYVGLMLLGLSEYAVALAVIAGFMELIPVIGPIVALIPAAVIGFFVSPVTGLGVVALYTLIQQLENHLIVPKVMQKAVGLNPLITIIAFMVGAQLLGLVGAVLAIPFTLILIEVSKYILKDYYSRPKAKVSRQTKTAK